MTVTRDDVAGMREDFDNGYFLLESARDLFTFIAQQDEQIERLKAVGRNFAESGVTLLDAATEKHSEIKELKAEIERLKEQLNQTKEPSE